jgi:hypothetical protein
VARRKSRRLARIEERRRQEREAKARDKAERAAARLAALRRHQAERAAEAEERRRQRLEERELARSRRAEERQVYRAPNRAAIDRANRKRRDALTRRSREAAEAFVDAGRVVTKATPIHIKIAQRAVIAAREEAARQADPLEQAKVALQRRGKVVHSMAVWGGRADRYFVSGLGKDVSAEQLLAEAQRLAA